VADAQQAIGLPSPSPRSSKPNSELFHDPQHLGREGRIIFDALLDRPHIELGGFTPCRQWPSKCSIYQPAAGQCAGDQECIEN